MSIAFRRSFLNSELICMSHYRNASVIRSESTTSTIHVLGMLCLT